MEIPLIKFIDFFFGVPLCFLLGMLLRIKDTLCPLKPGAPIRKILLLKTWGLGNIVLMHPSMKAIRENFPEASISFLTLKANRGIVEQNPFVDDYFLLDLSSAFRFCQSSWRAILHFRKRHPDVVIDFDQFSRFSAVLSLLVGARRRIGFDTRGQGKGWAFNLPVRYNNNQHTVCAFADLARRLGIKEIDLRPVRIAIGAEDKETVDNFLKENKVSSGDVLVGMHLGTGDNFPQRRWPLENFIELGRRLRRDYKVKIVLTGNSSEEQNLNRAFYQGLNAPGSALNAWGRFNVRQTAYLIQKCRFFISADTAPLHIGSAMGVPIVAIFGPNTPLLYGPRGSNDLVIYRRIACSPCLTNFNSKTSNCRDPQCITGITVDEVEEGIRKKAYV
jgi:ADP-heptose:LPS heptosyltransferase